MFREEQRQRWNEQPTLRDQFAMAALTGLLAHEACAATEASECAYRYADAMLEARKVQP